MEGLDHDVSAMHGYEGRNEIDSKTGADKEEIHSSVTQQNHSQGIINRNNSRNGIADR